MDELWRDVLFGLRGLLRKPGFATAAVLSLVLGLGTNTAIFTLLDAVFLRPLPLADLDRLVSVYHSIRNEAGEYAGENFISYPNYLDYQERSRSFSQLALYQWGPMNLTGGSEPQRVTGMYVTPNYFDLLALEPALGRLFGTQDADPASEAAAVLSHGCWQRLFGGDPEIRGRTLTVNGHSLTIVGVAPPGFRGTEMRVAVDVFLPLAMFERLSPFKAYFKVRGVAIFPALGKLADGVTAEQASTEMMGLARQLEEDYPKELEGLGAKALPLVDTTIVPRDRGRYVGYAKRLLIVLVILLIACLSVANLLFVRGVERSRELAVRQALGAGRGRVFRQLLTENLLLFVIGALVSLPVAGLFLEVLWSFRPPEIAESALDLRLDFVVWGFSLAAALAVGIVFGLWPALRAARIDLVSNLKESEPLAAGKGLPFLLRPRNLVVAMQVGLALLALIGAGLLIESLEKALEIDLGFDTDRLAVVSVAPGEQGYEEAQARDYYRRLVERARALPGVTAAALSQNRLLRGAVMRRQVFLPGREGAMEIGPMAFHRVNTVGPGFFETAGIALLKGRDFRDAEPEDLGVAIVNETMAERLWPGEDPIGKRFHFDYPNEPPVEVVGVAAKARYRQIREPEQFFIYVPLAQSYASGMTLHVRSEGDPRALLPTLRGEARELDNALVLADVRTMRHFVDEALWLERATTSLGALFGLLALALAVVGVYGLLAYSVSRRQRELGILFALGAQRGDVVLRVLLEAGRVVFAGVVLGLVLAWQLLDISLLNPQTYLVWSLVLLAAALAGSFIPAWRAARINPIETLRTE